MPPRRAYISVPALVVAVCFTAGCPDNSTPAPNAPGAASKAGEASSPADSPLKYTVLADTFDQKQNAVDFHVLVADGAKHDDVEKLLKYLYRHLETRKETPPGALLASVYSSEVQYKTPPRSPIATVSQKPGEIGPTFDNKVPLEFWQQIEVGLFGEDEKDRQKKLDANKAAKLAIKYDRNDAQKSLTVTFPYTQGGKDEWAETLSLNQAMNFFTDVAQAMFEKVPELSTLTYVGQWSTCKEHASTCPAEDVIKITLDRDTYHSLRLGDLDEQIGQIHGRAYLELSTHPGSDKQVSSANQARMAGLYKKMLAQLKGRAWVSPKLK